MGFWSRLGRTVRGRRHDEEIDEEIAFHLAMRRQDGLDARAARVRFGNPRAVHEQVRAAGTLAWLESLGHDARYALRQMRRTPLLTAAVISSLVLGIGANMGIFALVDAALLKSLPVKDPRSLVLVEWTSEGWPGAIVKGHTGNTWGQPAGHLRGSSVGAALHRRLAREQDAFAGLIGFSDANESSIVLGGRPAEQVSLQYVSGNFFEELGVSPPLGRPVGHDDDRVGAEPVVVLSHRLWQRAFGGRPDVVGDVARVNGVGVTIIGVAPPGFFGLEIGEWVDAYAPLAGRATLVPREPGAAAAEDDTYWWVRQIARVAPGVDGDAATRRLSADFQRLVVPDGVSLDPAQVPALVSVPARRGFDPVGGETATALWALLLLGGLVLLIVCANVANLLLARTVARQRESAIRLAIGAGRARLLQQSLVESVLLAACGAALGLYAGSHLAAAIHTLVTDGFATRALDIRVDGRVAAFTAGISMLTALLFGLAPAARLARAQPDQTLKAGSRSLVAGHLRGPRILVAGQIALSLTVLVTATLLAQTVSNLRHVDLGFERENLSYLSVNPWRAGMRAEQVGPYVERLRSAIARVPGVQQASTVASRPLSGSSSAAPANIPGRPFRDDGSDMMMLNELGDGALETLRIPLVGGRSFEPGDMQPGAAAVLVDERFVQQFFPGQYAIGQRFGVGTDSGPDHEVVGIVRNSRYNSLRTEPRPTVYRPHVPAQRRGRDIHLVVRMTGAVGQVAPAIQRAAADVDPTVPVVELFTQNALVDRMLTAERLLGTASTAFAIVALTLAAVGLTGLLGYVVARRRREIGLRMALGAAPGDVMRLVLRDCSWLVGLGILCGIPAAWAISYALAALLYDVRFTDARPLAFSVAALLCVAALAAWLPARRAARINPLLTLKAE